MIPACIFIVFLKKFFAVLINPNMWKQLQRVYLREYRDSNTEPAEGLKFRGGISNVVSVILE